MQLGNYQFYVAGSTCTNVLEGRHNNVMPKLYILLLASVLGVKRTQKVCVGYRNQDRVRVRFNRRGLANS